MTELIVPALIAFAAVTANIRRVDAFDAMTTGAAAGLRTLLRIFPSLLALLTGVYMLRSSGALDSMADLLSPLFGIFGIPPECAPLIMIRPISGSGALAVGAEIIHKYGADSLIGRTCAVMLGSTETTFYAIAVYFGAAGVKKTRWTVPAAITADAVGFFMAALTARLF
ncbi:MAG: spore maturation protein [Oscillospiraceae bacterium]|jgi:spore maturation protein B